jgi:hypothetical protein
MFILIFNLGCFKAPTDSVEKIKLKIISPVGNQALHLGDTVDIIFQADGDLYSSVGLKVAQANGLYFNITSSSVLLGQGVNIYTVQWIIGSEAEYSLKNPLFSDTNIADGSWRCKIQLYDYQGSDNTISDLFTVKLTEPYILRYPCASTKKSYKRSDTLWVQFTAQEDILANMSYFYWSTVSNKWYKIDYTIGNFSGKITGGTGIKTIRKMFLPEKPWPITETDSKLQAIGDSTKIKIIGTGDNAKPIESGWLKTIKVPTPDDTIKLKIDSPAGNQELHLGDTVDIIFQANGDLYSSVGLKIAQENGAYFNITSSSILLKQGLNSYTLKWIIGSEAEYSLNNPLYSDTTSTECKWRCKIQLYDYHGTNNFTTDYFNVKLDNPYCLRYPCAATKNMFRRSDTLWVMYTYRDDMFSNMLYYYWSIAGNKWYQINYSSGDFPGKKGDSYSVKTIRKMFLPDKPWPITETDTTLQIVGDSTKIKIIGYSSGNQTPKESGWIKLTN